MILEGLIPFLIYSGEDNKSDPFYILRISQNFEKLRKNVLEGKGL
jgi:hypothetical protein